MQELSTADVECLMCLVRWALREHRWRQGYEDLLGAAYGRAWSAATGAIRLGLSEGEVAKRITKAAGWAATDWLRSGENEERKEVRSSQSRGPSRGQSWKVVRPEQISWREGVAEIEARQRYSREDGWVDRLVEGMDQEREEEKEKIDQDG